MTVVELPAVSGPPRSPHERRDKATDMRPHPAAWKAKLCRTVEAFLAYKVVYLVSSKVALPPSPFPLYCGDMKYGSEHLISRPLECLVSGAPTMVGVLGAVPLTYL